jgi:D-3-phosphoglycerate dehydrogenase
VDTPYIFIDFDSTFIQVESLDILAKNALEGAPNQKEISDKIAFITEQGMNGEISFADSLSQRIALLTASKEDLEAIVTELLENVTGSFNQNKPFIEANADKIIIISSGFKEMIVPVVAEYGIPASQVYANTFTFDEDNNINGVDTTNPLAGNGGKIKVVESLNLNDKSCIIGDGYTDYEIRLSGNADKFYAFTENVSRDKVIKVADMIVTSFDEIIEDLQNI